MIDNQNKKENISNFYHYKGDKNPEIKNNLLTNHSKIISEQNINITNYEIILKPQNVFNKPLKKDKDIINEEEKGQDFSYNPNANQNKKPKVDLNKYNRDNYQNKIIKNNNDIHNNTSYNIYNNDINNNQIYLEILEIQLI